MRLTPQQHGAIKDRQIQKRKQRIQAEISSGEVVQRWIGEISNKRERPPCPACEAEIELGAAMLEVKGEAEMYHAACAMGVRQERAAYLARTAQKAFVCGRCGTTVHRGEELTLRERWHTWCEGMGDDE